MLNQTLNDLNNTQSSINGLDIGVEDLAIISDGSDGGIMAFSNMLHRRQETGGEHHYFAQRVDSARIVCWGAGGTWLYRDAVDPDASVKDIELAPDTPGIGGAFSVMYGVSANPVTTSTTYYHRLSGDGHIVGSKTMEELSSASQVASDPSVLPPGVYVISDNKSGVSGVLRAEKVDTGPPANDNCTNTIEIPITVGNQVTTLPAFFSDCPVSTSDENFLSCNDNGINPINYPAASSGLSLKSKDRPKGRGIEPRLRNKKEKRRFVYEGETVVNEIFSGRGASLSDICS